MKNGKKPTVAQRKFIEQHGLNSQNWMVTVDAPDRMEVVHRHSDLQRRTILKNDFYEEDDS